MFSYVVPCTSANGVTGRPSQGSAERGRELLTEMGVEEVFGDFKDIYLKQKLREWEDGFYPIRDEQFEDRLTFI